VLVPSPSGPDGCKVRQADQLHAAVISQREMSVQFRQLVRSAGEEEPGELEWLEIHDGGPLQPHRDSHSIHAQ